MIINIGVAGADGAASRSGFVGSVAGAAAVVAAVCDRYMRCGCRSGSIVDIGLQGFGNDADKVE